TSNPIGPVAVTEPSLHPNGPSRTVRGTPNNPVGDVDPDISIEEARPIRLETDNKQAGDEKAEDKTGAKTKVLPIRGKDDKSPDPGRSDSAPKASTSNSESRPNSLEKPGEAKGDQTKTTGSGTGGFSNTVTPTSLVPPVTTATTSGPGTGTVATTPQPP